MCIENNRPAYSPGMFWAARLNFIQLDFSISCTYFLFIYLCWLYVLYQLCQPAKCGGRKLWLLLGAAAATTDGRVNIDNGPKSHCSYDTVRKRQQVGSSLTLVSHASRQKACCHASVKGGGGADPNRPQCFILDIFLKEMAKKQTRGLTVHSILFVSSWTGGKDLPVYTHVCIFVSFYWPVILIKYKRFGCFPTAAHSGLPATVSSLYV